MPLGHPSSQICIQNVLKVIPKEVQKQPKIDKIQVWTTKVSIGCPCAPLDHQNGHPGFPKWSLKL